MVLSPPPTFALWLYSQRSHDGELTAKGTLETRRVF